VDGYQDRFGNENRILNYTLTLTFISFRTANPSTVSGV